MLTNIKMLPLEIVEKIIQYTDDILLYISLEFDNQHYINKFTKNYKKVINIRNPIYKNLELVI